MSSYLDPISIEDVPIVDKVCAECGSDKVWLAGCIAFWSITKQEWVLQEPPDTDKELHFSWEGVMVWCGKCDMKTTTKNEEV